MWLGRINRDYLAGIERNVGMHAANDVVQLRHFTLDHDLSACIDRVRVVNTVFIFDDQRAGLCGYDRSFDDGYFACRLGLGARGRDKADNKENRELS